MADVDRAVKEAVIEALALDVGEMTPESTLMDDLGAESMDLLDILFRIETSTGVKIEPSDLGEYIQGGVPDDEFSDADHFVSARGAEQLHEVMPQTDPAELAGKVNADDVMTLFTVQNLVDMVQAPRRPHRRPIGSRRASLKLRIGVDLVGVARLERVVGGDERRQARLFTPGELAYCHGKRRCYERMAARFAAKEAVLKAFGTGISQRMRWTDVEVVNESSGRPRIELDGAVATFARQHGLTDLDVSLSHTEGLALAHAVSMWEQPDRATPAVLR